MRGTSRALPIRSSARKKGLALLLEVEPDVPDTVDCDRVKLLQVLHNLLHNAIKFTDAGQVRLQLARAGTELVFAVAGFATVRDDLVVDLTEVWADVGQDAPDGTRPV